MKKSRFSEQQIAFILKQAEDGTTVEEVCRKAGISIQTYHRWRSKYGGLMPSEIKRLKQLEEENVRLKRLVELVGYMQASYGVSQRRACDVLPTHRAWSPCQISSSMAARSGFRWGLYEAPKLGPHRP